MCVPNSITPIKQSCYLNIILLPTLLFIGSNVDDVGDVAQSLKFEKVGNLNNEFLEGENVGVIQKVEEAQNTRMKGSYVNDNCLSRLEVKVPLVQNEPDR